MHIQIDRHKTQVLKYSKIETRSETSKSGDMSCLDAKMRCVHEFYTVFLTYRILPLYIKFMFIIT